MILGRVTRYTALKARAFQCPTQMTAIRTITSYDSSHDRSVLTRNIQPVLCYNNKQVSPLVPKTYHKIQARGVHNPSGLSWEAIPAKPEILGAIMPFADLNFIQVLVFPYTYAIMYYMDFLLDYMPWWMAIVSTVTTFRLLFFPFTVQQNIIGIKTNNILPETQKIQTKMNEAFAEGDSNSAAIERAKMKDLFNEHGLSMSARLRPMFVQMPAQLTTFFLLKNLAYYPSATMATGGALWFNNLTLADPYYILPTLASASTFILINYGLEGTTGPLSKAGPLMKWGMRIVPLFIFGITLRFPAAVVLYWTTSNFITLLYAFILKTNTVKKIFKIPKSIEHDPSKLPISNMSFREQIKQNKLKASAKTTHDVRRLDEIQFRKAGIGPLQKTYKEMPRPAVKEDKF